MGTGIHEYNGTRWQGRRGARVGWVHGTHTVRTLLGAAQSITVEKAHTVALEMDMLHFLMFLGTPGPTLCLVLVAWCVLLCWERCLSYF